MAIEKTWTFTKVKDKAVEYILSIPADNINAVPTLPSTMQANYKWDKKSCTIPNCYGIAKLSEEVKEDSPGNWKNNRGHRYIYGPNNPTKTNYTFYAEFNTDQTIPVALLESKSKSTIQTQFETLLKNRKLTEDDIKGKVISIRTVQAIIETMVQFIVARYQIWTDPVGKNSLVLYNDGSVSYSSLNYNYSIVDVNDKLTKEGVSELMNSIYLSALSSIRTKRQGMACTFTSSSSSSSSSSSCSSSCSSSSSSSSCSSSCSSSVFIAYMNLGI